MALSPAPAKQWGVGAVCPNSAKTIENSSMATITPPTPLNLLQIQYKMKYPG
jgi:hypothetical protein